VWSVSGALAKNEKGDIMQFEFIVVPVQNIEMAQMELNKFLKSHRIVTVQKEFVCEGSNSFWAVSIEYLDDPGEGQKNLFGRKQKVDYRDVLSDLDFTLYSKLRELRKTIAESEGVPVYTIFTNDQLAEIVTKRVASKTDMCKIAGIGEAKIAKYAESFLKLLKSENIKENEKSGKSVSDDSRL